MIRISPHLCFNGDCRAAFEQYHRILGGTLKTMLTYGESPIAVHVSPQWYRRIVHATLEFENVELTGADLLPEDYRKPRGFFVTLGIEDVSRATSVFAALAEGGAIRVPFEPTFWSAGYGVLVDRFHIPWEVNCIQPPTTERHR
jgi:PhnB protein